MDLVVCIIKKLKKACSKEEEKYINNWIKTSKENVQFFHRLEILNENGKNISEVLELDSKKAWKTILLKNNKLISNLKMSNY